MNPVDHVRYPEPLLTTPTDKCFSSLTVVVTINILVKPRLSLATPHKVKRPVSSPPGELVCSAVPRRRRTRGCKDDGVRWELHAIQAAPMVVVFIKHIGCDKVSARFFVAEYVRQKPQTGLNTNDFL
jgi:hypothetical protein